AAFTRLDDVCLAINPRHTEFYTKFFECQVLGGAASYGSVNGAAAVPMRLDLHTVRDLIAEARTGGCRDSEIRSFLYDPDALERIASLLQREVPRSALTSEQFAYFFHGGAALRNASPERRLLVESIHRDPSQSTTGPAVVFSLWDLIKPAVRNAPLSWACGPSRARPA